MPNDAFTAGDDRYTRTAAALHWLLALLIVGAFGMGLYMTDLPLSPQRMRFTNWHKWAGVTILALSALRLLWRLAHRPPPDVPMPPWQRRLAHTTHRLMYVLFFAVPLVGWCYSSAAGYPVVWFGVLPLPDPVAPDRALAATLKPLHGWLARALALLVLLHLAGALKHHFIDRDGLLRRMRLTRR